MHAAQVLVLADTHLRDGQADRLIERLGDRLRVATAIVHAGDVTDTSVLDALAEAAPVHAVLGNNDHGLLLPERIEVRIAGCSIAAVHDSGPSAGRAARLRRWFPTADVVVFGHSHAPWHERHVDERGHVQHHVNPGSAMQRRREPHCTVAWVSLVGAQVTEVRHERVG